MEIPVKKDIYQLIQSVEPTKIKVPIREKFAKLTLSSNKKKGQQAKAEDEQENLQHIKLKQNRTSRNLLQELNSQYDDNAKIDAAKDDKVLQTAVERRFVNPLLRSSSSSKDSSSITDALEETHVNTELAKALLNKSTESQEHEIDIGQEVNALSQKLSVLAVTTNPQMPRVKREEIVLNPHKSIYISSDSEEDDEIDLSDTIISLSDYDDNTPFDIEVATSNIPATGETADALLPCTFSNEKADRIEAFLHDISQQRKNINVEATEDIFEFDKVFSHKTEQLTKAQQIARADTESVSANSVIKSEFISVRYTEDKEHKPNHLVFNDTVTMGETQSWPTFTQSQDVETNAGIKEIAAKRLIHDETEANTINLTVDESCSYSSSENKQQNTSLLSNNLEYSSSPPPDESILIPETSSESEPLEQQLSTTTDGERLQSEERCLTEEQTTPEFYSQPPKIQMNVGSINISAKINIKIHISQQAESSCEEVEEPSENEGQNDDAKQQPDKLTELQAVPSSLSASRHAEEHYNSHSSMTSELTAENCNEKKNVHEDVAKETESKNKSDNNFLTHAEKLLNQLYGNSWKTPEVVRTLKRTSGKRTNVSPQSVKKQNYTENKPTVIRAECKPVEESMIDDFSIFRRNIVKTNLDSTRLAGRTPKSDQKKRTPKKTCDLFKVPQTERIKLVTASAAKQWRPNTQERRRKFLNENDSSDNAGENASDDSRIFLTSDESDVSWCQSDDDSNDYNTRNKKGNRKAGKSKNKRDDKVIFLDLSKDQIEVQKDVSSSPPANHDENFQKRLQDILRTCKPAEKPKLESTPQTSNKPRRRQLFTKNYDDVDINNDETKESPIEIKQTTTPKSNTPKDDNTVRFNGNSPPWLKKLNKPLEALKANGGKPVFKQTLPKNQNETPKKTPSASKGTVKSNALNSNENTPNSAKKAILLEENTFPDKQTYKYSFLASLDEFIRKPFCQPDALYYRENFRLKKEELTIKLYDLYNEKLFDSELDVPIVWNKKLLNTAGRCLNKRKLNVRSSVVELSDKVLTTACRLRCTLIHELCHAATWVFNGEGGHGATWRQWACKANSTFPELPKIGVCHQYDIEYKYTYKCTLCAAKSHAHSKSRKVENIRCAFCHGAIEVFLNKKDKEGNILPTPVKEPKGFAKFVKDNYKQYKQQDMKHADVMKVLSNEFAALKVAGNKK